MTPRAVLRSAVAGALAVLPLVPSAIAAPVLRSADVQITITSETSCDVTMDLAVTGASQIDHRVEAFDDSRIELIDVRGADQLEHVRIVGRTQSLVLSPRDTRYAFHYRSHSGSQANRCPIWLPTAPTRGEPGAIRLSVDIPNATIAGNTMPAFAWTGTHGVVALAHMPSVVRVSYTRAGEGRPWDVGRAMDALAAIVFVPASGIWVWRARR